MKTTGVAQGDFESRMITLTSMSIIGLFISISCLIMTLSVSCVCYYTNAAQLAIFSGKLTFQLYQ